MKLLKPFIYIALPIFLASSAPAARADDLDASIKKQLGTFDPAAVAAARHYYTSPVLKASMVAMISKMTDAMGVVLDRANPGLDESKKKAALSVVQETLNDKLDLIIDLSMISALQVLSKDDLIAIDKFYSSPVGQSVLVKMPLVMNRLPAMMQIIMPGLLDDMRMRMKANGLDVKI
jgi:hypothetical protein